MSTRAILIRGSAATSDKGCAQAARALAFSQATGRRAYLSEADMSYLAPAVAFSRSAPAREA